MTDLRCDPRWMPHNSCHVWRHCCVRLQTMIHENTDAENTQRNLITPMPLCSLFPLLILEILVLGTEPHPGMKCAVLTSKSKCLPWLCLTECCGKGWVMQGAGLTPPQSGGRGERRPGQLLDTAMMDGPTHCQLLVCSPYLCWTVISSSGPSLGWYVDRCREWWLFCVNSVAVAHNYKTACVLIHTHTIHQLILVTGLYLSVCVAIRLCCGPELY